MVESRPPMQDHNHHLFPTTELTTLPESARFSQALSGTLNLLRLWEGTILSEPDREIKYLDSRRQVENELEAVGMPGEERLLFARLFDLFEIKHKIGEEKESYFRMVFEEPRGRVIGFLGPLGVGKSSIARILAQDLNAIETEEPYKENPFWQDSQTATERAQFMLRSQVFFLISNIEKDMSAKTKQGLVISDTNTFADRYLWAEWYGQIGRFDKGDLDIYRELMEFFDPVIPRPDFLVTLVPDSVEYLEQGIRQRAANEEARIGETEFTHDELARQVIIAQQTAVEISQGSLSQGSLRREIPVLTLNGDPVETYTNPSIGYDFIYRIRNALGILSELLEPKPEEVVNQVLQILADSTERQLIIIHAQSMFTGKTTALCQLAERVGKEKVIAFQPKAGIRYPEQEKQIISRDGSRIPAHLIEDNSLWSIVQYLKKEVDQGRINPRERPYVVIDELQLFFEEENNPQLAIKALEDIRNMGFHVIVDGIDYTFQGEPFTFMHDLIRETFCNNCWHAIEMSTRCRYCEERATASNLLVPDPDGHLVVADYNYYKFTAGDQDTTEVSYEPVCDKHAKCGGRPLGWVKQALPRNA